MDAIRAVARTGHLSKWSINGTRASYRWIIETLEVLDIAKKSMIVVSISLLICNNWIKETEQSYTHDFILNVSRKDTSDDFVFLLSSM